MAPRVALGAGQRPQRQYINRATRFFFEELDKGLSSPYIVLSCGALASLVGWKVFDRYIVPRRASDAVWRQPHSRVPLSDAHNVFWGLGTGVPIGRHSAESMTSAAEEALRRPVLVHGEESEVRGPNGEAKRVVCMEIPEYDAKRGNDVMFRSVHYIQDPAVPVSTTGNTKATEGKESSAQEDPTDENSYLARMPARGASVVHGMVKCRGLTALNNCVPYAGHLESEYARKLMLALGPVHILRDVAKTMLPMRFTMAKEAPVSTLICGLHSGEVPRWLSSAFPNFHVDVVERDGALVRMCRRFLGFQESSNLHLFVADPLDFLRRTAVPDVGRRYDLIMLDTLDGDGKLATPYARLEFMNSVRNSLTSAGCVVAVLPNRDGAFLYNVVQNWRMAFAGRTVLLVHCVTSPHTLLMSFQDDAARGKANFGTVANVDEFRDLLRANLSHYGPQRVPFDLTGEVTDDSFRVLRPGAVYSPAAYLPLGHPELARAAEYAAGGYASEARGSGWAARLRRWSSAWLTPTQRADLRRMQN